MKIKMLTCSEICTQMEPAILTRGGIRYKAGLSNVWRGRGLILLTSSETVIGPLIIHQIATLSVSSQQLQKSEKFQSEERVAVTTGTRRIHAYLLLS